MILLEHRLREEEAGLGVSSGPGGETLHQDSVWFNILNISFFTLKFLRFPGDPEMQVHAVEEYLHVWNKMRANSPKQSLR